jgi:hypothetical protein
LVILINSPCRSPAVTSVTLFGVFYLKLCFLSSFQLVGSVASFIIYSNSAALVGRSIPRDDLDLINAELEQDVMIRAIHDVKGIDMGNTLVRYKAEVDFDGRELTKAYLEKMDIKLLLEVSKSLKKLIGSPIISMSWKAFPILNLFLLW